ncbi:MAG: M23 family metallopeptidase [Propionibacteriaceae bacterium]|nr:M23 family metallopeptidase [Propionibacteriaceae bacterium]
MLKQFRPLVAAVSAVLFIAGAMSIALWGTEPGLRAVPEVAAQPAERSSRSQERAPMGSGDGALLMVAAPTMAAVDQLPIAPDQAEAPGEDTTVLNVPSAIPTEVLDQVDADGGKLLSQPVRGRITSRFGMRFHPVLHVWKLHTGLDFAAPCGAPVGASAPGRVTRTGWAGGNGVQVRVDHGQIAGHHVVTTYNHLSSVAVTVGQQVTTHQGVGRIGNTGYSTGCHLHFEVIVDGKFQNPESWLNGVPAVDASFAAPPSTLPVPASSAPKAPVSPSASASTKPAPSPSVSSSPSARPTQRSSAPRTPTPTPGPSASRTPSPTPSPSRSEQEPSPAPSQSESAGKSSPSAEESAPAR